MKLTRNRQTRKIKNTEKNKYQGQKNDWSENALDDILETLREQLVKEMNDRSNKWIMFAKRLEKRDKKYH